MAKVASFEYKQSDERGKSGFLCDVRVGLMCWDAKKGGWVEGIWCRVTYMNIYTLRGRRTLVCILGVCWRQGYTAECLFGTASISFCPYEKGEVHIHV